MNPRRIALEALLDIVERGAYANLVIKKRCATLPERESAQVASLVYTTLDHLLTVDYYLSHYTKGAQKPAVRMILRMGACELLFRATPAHAAVSESVQLAREIGKGALTGFVNAVLRALDRARDALPPLPTEPVERLSIQYSYPAWIVREWLEAYGETQAEALLASPAAPVEVRAQWPCTRDELRAALPVASRPGLWDENALLLESGFDFASSPLYAEGKLAIMGQAAMLACRALGELKGLRVLDACAAPGGKAAYLASLCQNEIALTCLELHAHRKALLERTLERMRVAADIRMQDASVYDAAFDGAFDAVLLDAPCSGLGLLADKPDIRYTKSDGDVESLAALQSLLLDVCCRYVRPGGLLLYATCTISRRENEGQIAAFLARTPAFSLERMPLPLENDGALQLLPHVHHTDGFYLARMRKCF